MLAQRLILRVLVVLVVVLAVRKHYVRNTLANIVRTGRRGMAACSQSLKQREHLQLCGESREGTASGVRL